MIRVHVHESAQTTSTASLSIQYFWLDQKSGEFDSAVEQARMRPCLHRTFEKKSASMRSLHAPNLGQPHYVGRPTTVHSNPHLRASTFRADRRTCGVVPSGAIGPVDVWMYYVTRLKLEPPGGWRLYSIILQFYMNIKNEASLSFQITFATSRAPCRAWL